MDEKQYGVTNRTYYKKLAELVREKKGETVEEKTASGSIASFDDGTGLPVKSLTVEIKPVQEGKGDPSPDNVRPISGREKVSIAKTRKNIAHDVTYYDAKRIYSVAIRASYQLVKGKRYILSFDTENTGFMVYHQVEEKTGLTNYNRYNARCDGKRQFFIATASVSGIFNDVAIFNRNSESSETGTGICSNFMIEAVADDVSQPTAYEPYEGDTYEIAFPAEAGTVYGGALDVTAGTLTVTHENIAEYAGEALPGAWISSEDVYVAGATPTFGAQVVYELAAPRVYQLAPREVTTLHGANHIYADTGGVSVTYDANLYAPAQLEPELRGQFDRAPSLSTYIFSELGGVVDDSSIDVAISKKNSPVGVLQKMIRPDITMLRLRKCPSIETDSYLESDPYIRSIQFDLIRDMYYADIAKCENLVKVILGGSSKFGHIFLFDCPKLDALVMTSTVITPRYRTSVLNNTGITNGTGYIYVPASVIEAYRAESSWAGLEDRFRAIEDYDGIDDWLNLELPE